jgi:hypothetical protein
MYIVSGSAWMMLTHHFIEYCIWGWDNLPRTVLMYYANFLSSPKQQINSELGVHNWLVCTCLYYHFICLNTLFFWNWRNTNMHSEDFSYYLYMQDEVKNMKTSNTVRCMELGFVLGSMSKNSPISGHRGHWASVSSTASSAAASPSAAGSE